ncbi:MAG: SIMPL domain-containing protein [Candidatus Diapherotrites archaeon]
MKEKNPIIVLGAVFLIVIALVSIMPAFSHNAFADENGSDSKEEKRTVSVSAVSSISTAPNQTEIYLSIETDNLNAAKSQQENAEITAKVKKALLSAGVKETEIESTNYSLNELNEWDSISRKYIKKGYQTTHSLKVTVQGTSNAGTIVDAAVSAGTTRISGVSFTVDDKTREGIQLQALEQAAKTSKTKAETIAKGLGVKVKQVESADESSGYYYPQVNYSKTMMEASDGAMPTEFSAGDIQITATVSAVYSIE